LRTDEVGQRVAVRVQIGRHELLVLVGEARGLTHGLARPFAVWDVEHPVVVNAGIGDVHRVAADADANGGAQHHVRPDPAALQPAAKAIVDGFDPDGFVVEVANMGLHPVLVMQAAQMEEHASRGTREHPAARVVVVE
jgi:hypothetical protein